MIERWRNVVGYEGYYEVSDQGNVRSVDRIISCRGWPHKCKGRILRPSTATRVGHLGVTLYREGKKWNVLVHRLVLFAFVGPPPTGYECCHGSAGPTNNSIDNLRWDTHSENIKDSVRAGTHRIKVVRSDGKEYPSMTDAARDVGCSHQIISKACKSKTNKAKGYGWFYV